MLLYDTRRLIILSIYVKRRKYDFFCFRQVLSILDRTVSVDPVSLEDNLFFTKVSCGHSLFRYGTDTTSFSFYSRVVFTQIYVCFFS